MNPLFKMSVHTSMVSGHAEGLTEAPDRTEKTVDTLMLNETDEHAALTSPRNVHGITWVVVCVSIYISCMMYGLDMTIAADVQATIIVQFDSVERLAWVGSGFLLGSVCSIFPV